MNPKLYGKIMTNPQTAIYVKAPRVYFKNFAPKKAITVPKISSKKPINLKNPAMIFLSGDKSIPQPAGPE